MASAVAPLGEAGVGDAEAGGPVVVGVAGSAWAARSKADTEASDGGAEGASVVAVDSAALWPAGRVCPVVVGSAAWTATVCTPDICERGACETGACDSGVCSSGVGRASDPDANAVARTEGGVTVDAD